MKSSTPLLVNDEPTPTSAPYMHRLIFAVFLFFGLCNVYMLRVNLSVAFADAGTVSLEQRNKGNHSLVFLRHLFVKYLVVTSRLSMVPSLCLGVEFCVPQF